MTQGDTGKHETTQVTLHQDGLPSPAALSHNTCGSLGPCYPSCKAVSGQGGRGRRPLAHPGPAPFTCLLRQGSERTLFPTWIFSCGLPSVQSWKALGASRHEKPVMETSPAGRPVPGTNHSLRLPQGPPPMCTHTAQKRTLFAQCIQMKVTGSQAILQD